MRGICTSTRVGDSKSKVFGCIGSVRRRDENRLVCTVVERVRESSLGSTGVNVAVRVWRSDDRGVCMHCAVSGVSGNEKGIDPGIPDEEEEDGLDLE